MALDIGACRYGNWLDGKLCHGGAIAPEYGDLNMLESSYRHSYPYWIMINADGKRFVDQGADFYNDTYTKYGAEVLRQPEQFAYQVFDARPDLLRPEYGTTRLPASLPIRWKIGRETRGGQCGKLPEDGARIQRCGYGRSA